MTAIKPHLLGIDVVAAQPRDVDVQRLEYYSAQAAAPLPAIVYVVRLFLSAPPPSTSTGMEVYVGETRIYEYGVWREGAFFLVHDPRFLAEHAGQSISFSFDGATREATGRVLPGSPGTTELASAAVRKLTFVAGLPSLENALTPASK